DWLNAGDFSIDDDVLPYTVEVGRPSIGATKESGSSESTTPERVWTNWNRDYEKSDAQRRAYGMAISILRKLTGEYFKNNGLPGYLWSAGYASWSRTAQQLGRIDGNSGLSLLKTSSPCELLKLRISTC